MGYDIKRVTIYKSIVLTIIIARAKYDYVPKEVDELPFEACNLIGILAVDVLYKGWWTGAIYDGHRQTWSIAASVPSNFMERLC